MQRIFHGKNDPNSSNIEKKKIQIAKFEKMVIKQLTCDLILNTKEIW
jgi:hypothetical protein